MGPPATSRELDRVWSYFVRVWRDQSRSLPLPWYGVPILAIAVVYCLRT